jgi:hypothetical protein
MCYKRKKGGVWNLRGFINKHHLKVFQVNVDKKNKNVHITNQTNQEGSKL